jgi:hypothetical protein
MVAKFFERIVFTTPLAPFDAHGAHRHHMVLRHTRCDHSTASERTGQLPVLAVVPVVVEHVFDHHLCSTTLSAWNRPPHAETQVFSHLYRFHLLTAADYTVYLAVPAVLIKVLLLKAGLLLHTTVYAWYNTLYTLRAQVMVNFLEHQQPLAAFSGAAYHAVDALTVVIGHLAGFHGLAAA